MAMLAFGSSALWLVIGVDPRISSTGNFTVALAAQIAFHAIASIFYLPHFKKIARGMLGTPWIMALVVFAICSTLWSQDPALTFRRSLILLATTVFGIYFGTRFPMREQVQILAWTILVVLVASVCVAIALPQYGVDTGPHFGNWRGLFHQKNMLARIAVLGICVFLAWRPAFRPMRYLAIVGAVAVLLMTRSATGLIVFLAIVLAHQLFQLLRAPAIMWLPVFIALFAAGAGLALVLLNNPEFAVSTMGRDVTLTGRTELWRAVLIAISKRPLFGYGFDGFWLGMQGESATLTVAVRWVAVQAHNGFLELWLNLGAIGLSLFLIPYFIGLRNAFRFYLAGRDAIRVWPLLYLSFMFLYNLTEATEMEQNSIFMVLFASVVASLAFHPAREREVNPPTFEFEACNVEA